MHDMVDMISRMISRRLLGVVLGPDVLLHRKGEGLDLRIGTRVRLRPTAYNSELGSVEAQETLRSRQRCE